jgi:biopolymer transport protein ExbD
MLTLRRTVHEPRIEMVPLIDVIFLLLTFFVYAMVLMIRADLLPVKMQAFRHGEPGRPNPAAAITIDAAGSLFLNREPIAPDEVADRLRALRAGQPNLIVYVAADEHGRVDRLPAFLDLYDRLSPLGLDLRLVGRPPAQEE